LLVVWLSGQMTFGWPFALCFVVIGAAGFAIALAIAHFITLALWARDYDPGESAARGRHDMFT
jgi:solute carrier family 41